MSSLAVGIYEKILDEELQELLQQNPELKPILRKIDDEEAPQIYAQFVGNLLKQALHIAKKDERVSIVNRVLELLASTDGLDYVKRNTLLSVNKNLLTEVRKTQNAFVRPETPLSTSALLTGQGIDPPLEHELRAEMLTADRVDILISFHYHPIGCRISAGHPLPPFIYRGLRMDFELFKNRGLSLIFRRVVYFGVF